MTEIIKKHKKITIGTMTAVAALVLLLLNIYEKTEAIISKATPSSDKKVAYELSGGLKYDLNEPARKK